MDIKNSVPLVYGKSKVMNKKNAFNLSSIIKKGLIGLYLEFEI